MNEWNFFMFVFLYRYWMRILKKAAQCCSAKTGIRETVLVRSELIINRSDLSLQWVICRIFRMFSEFLIVPDLSIFLDTGLL